MKPQLIPECRVYTTNLHVEVCGYADLEDVKKLLTLDSELVLRRAQVKLLRETITALTIQRDGFKLALEAEQRADLIIRDRNTQLTKQLIDTDRKLQTALVRPRSGSVLAWGIAAAAVAALIGIIAEKVIP